jgi:membrane-associated phospholipid phosphatase
LPEAGFIDTLQVYNNLSYQAQSTQFFVNPYAAMPSLHVGWAVLVAIGVLRAFPGNRFVVVLAVLHPLAQAASTVVTGNHYLLDAVGGLAAAGLGVVGAGVMERWGYGGLSQIMRRRHVERGRW